MHYACAIRSCSLSVYGTLVFSNGHHGLFCKKNAGRQYRHPAVNDITARTFRSIDVPAVLEPPGLLKGDDKGLSTRQLELNNNLRYKGMHSIP